MCLGGDDNTLETFSVVAEALNEVNVTVEAKITEGEGECGEGFVAGEAEGRKRIMNLVQTIKCVTIAISDE